MNLFETLKQLKAIQPDPAFKENSRRTILATEPAPRILPSLKSLSPRRLIFRLVETGAAVALTGFFILLLMGGLSGSKFAPVQYSSIDPTALKAEAKAIDIQIQLANVKYSEAAASTAALAGPKRPVLAAGLMAAATATSTEAASSTATTTAISIDQALQGLTN